MLIIILPKAKIMIYTTKRFSVGDAATGFGIGAGAGAILGVKIEGGIKKVSHDLKYDNNKFLAQLEKEKEETKEFQIIMKSLRMSQINQTGRTTKITRNI